GGGSLRGMGGWLGGVGNGRGSRTGPGPFVAVCDRVTVRSQWYEGCRLAAMAHGSKVTQGIYAATCMAATPRVVGRFPNSGKLTRGRKETRSAPNAIQRNRRTASS